MSVVAWGYGKSGALGNGELQDQLYPVVVSGQLRGKHGMNLFDSFFISLYSI